MDPLFMDAQMYVGTNHACSAVSYTADMYCTPRARRPNTIHASFT